MLLLLQGAGAQADLTPKGGVGHFRSVQSSLERLETDLNSRRTGINVPRQGFRPVNPRRVE